MNNPSSPFQQPHAPPPPISEPPQPSPPRCSDNHHCHHQHPTHHRTNLYTQHRHHQEKISNKPYHPLAQTPRTPQTQMILPQIIHFFCLTKLKKTKKDFLLFLNLPLYAPESDDKVRYRPLVRVYYPNKCN